MLSVTRVDHRRVLVLGLAGLVPAALVALLLVHQPSIGDRRLYPLLRGPLTFVGLALALIALLTWATSPPRLTRSSLCGLAWAGVTAILCIGPFLESTPRSRLYALELATGDMVWTTSAAGTAPVMLDGDLVVTDARGRSLVGLDPATGSERWRRPITDDLPTEETSAGIGVVDGGLRGGSWSVSLPGERVVDAAVVGDSAYAYVVTPGANGVDGGAIIGLDVDDGEVRWRTALPETVAAAAGAATIGAGGDAVVVAGGERVAALDADDGQVRWDHSIASLGKSRGHALPGAVQQVTVTDSLVFLSTTPDR